jgi:hypothetical protein
VSSHPYSGEVVSIARTIVGHLVIEIGRTKSPKR